MSGPDRPSYDLEITEDSKEGIAIRLRHNVGRPDILAGIPKDILKRSRPWIWSDYERRVLKKARGMSYESYRIVRDTLLLERAKMLMATQPHPKGPARLGVLERIRLWRAHEAKVTAMEPGEQTTRHVGLSLTEEATRRIGERMREASPDGLVLNHIPKVEPTLTEQMRDQTATALSSPKPKPVQDRAR